MNRRWTELATTVTVTSELSYADAMRLMACLWLKHSFGQGTGNGMLRGVGIESSTFDSFEAFLLQANDTALALHRRPFAAVAGIAASIDGAASSGGAHSHGTQAAPAMAAAGSAASRPSSTTQEACLDLPTFPLFEWNDAAPWQEPWWTEYEEPQQVQLRSVWAEGGRETTIEIEGWSYLVILEPSRMRQIAQHSEFARSVRVWVNPDEVRS